MEPSDNRDANFLAHKQDFAYFLAPDNGETFYIDKIEQMVNNEDNRLIVNLRDINEYNSNLRRNILQEPMEYIPAWEDALKDYISHNLSVEKQRMLLKDYKIGLKGSFGGNRLTPQKLMSQSVGTMVCCEGIVTKVSLVRPKVKETVHFCEATQQFTTAQYRDGTSLMGSSTGSTYPTTDSNGNNLTTEFGLCTFEDHQKIYIQDMPERTEPGSMPQTIECILDSDLVDHCKPGDRVQIIGIYRALCGRRIAGESSGKFHTVILVNNVVKIGIGKSGSQSQSETLSANEIKNIKKYAKKKNIFSTLANSIIPSIHGHDFIKKAIVLQLLGGVTKDLDNGTHLRGDINILMIGDPSCGKSQLLRGVMNIGKLVINTTGRGSSGVGLTAAVTMDRDSGERKLEAGAMVLADGGIVCIDEFDKMTDIDRTAIHEVMEQQTVTIAKAGIHTSLNARCSVIAAANPVYGMYDRHKKPFENIGLPDSLLSRFDLLFIVLDKIDTQIDRNISEHVIKMHLTPYMAGDDAIDIDLLNEENENEDEMDGDASVWSKQRIGVGNGKKKEKIFTNEFVKKYINFAKKQYKPVLTDEACQEIANQYSKLREQERNQTLPITARCLETIIRLSTAHAKLRLSKRIALSDVNAAVQVLNFALINDAEPEQKKKRKLGDDGSESDKGSDEDEDSDAKMMELGDEDSGVQTRQRKRRTITGDEASESEVSSKRVRRSQRNIESSIEDENVKSVKQILANYFRVNRIGQINKGELLKKVNEESEMSKNELEKILKFLHEKNKIFYIDPMVHQL